MPNSYPFPIDPKLTGIALAYKNDSYIADSVLPRVKVPSSTFRYRIYDKGSFLTPVDARVGRKSQPNEVEIGFTEASSFVEDFGLDDVIPYDDILNAPDGYNPQYEAVEYLTEMIALNREKRVADLVFDEKNYAEGCHKALTGDAQFSSTKSNPLSILIEALETPFVRPNTIIMGREVWIKLCRHSGILQTFYPNANGNGIITPEQLASILDVERVLIGNARINTAHRGQAANIGRLWGKHVALLYLDPAATVNHRLTWGITAEFGNRVSGSMAEPEKGLRGSTKVRVGETVRELVLCNEAGYFLKDAVA